MSLSRFRTEAAASGPPSGSARKMRIARMHETMRFSKHFSILSELQEPRCVETLRRIGHRIDNVDRFWPREDQRESGETKWKCHEESVVVTIS